MRSMREGAVGRSTPACMGPQMQAAVMPRTLAMPRVPRDATRACCAHARVMPHICDASHPARCHARVAYDMRALRTSCARDHACIACERLAAHSRRQARMLP